MKYLVALLFFLSGAAFADSLVANDPALGKVVVDLSKPCKDPKVAEAVESPKDYRQASLVYEGKTYKGCGADYKDFVCLVFPELGHADAPIDMFKKLTNVKK